MNRDEPKPDYMTLDNVTDLRFKVISMETLRVLCEIPCSHDLLMPLVLDATTVHILVDDDYQIEMKGCISRLDKSTCTIQLYGDPIVG